MANFDKNALIKIIEQGDLSYTLWEHLKNIVEEIRTDLYNKWCQDLDNKNWETIKAEISVLNTLINKINSKINYGQLAKEELEDNRKLTLSTYK